MKSLPSGMRSAVDLDESERLSAEVVVIGLGAGGGMVFHDLARRGVDVLGLEMGGHYSPEDMACREDEMLPKLFCEAGSRATDDFAISILQGKGVGGSTIHNTNLCKRLPVEILERWEAEYGVEGLLDGQLDRDFAAVEQLLGVHQVPDERVNRQNRVLARGLEKTGFKGGRLSHNRHPDDCKQSGFCELGCPNNGKQNAAKVLVPRGLEAGGRVVCQARVERVLHQDGRVTGVACAAVDAEDGRVYQRFGVDAEVVVLAASATGSAALHKKSGLGDPHNLAGTNLHLHPGATVIGLFDGPEDEPIEGWLGNPQSVECTEFLEFDRHADQRAWIVTGFAHPAGAAGFVPGFGASHVALMRKFPRIASLVVMLHDHASGRVAPGDGEQVHVSYSLDREEYRQFALGLKGAARLLLAAGARKVVVPTTPALEATCEADLGALTVDKLGPFSPALAAVHPMSTLWMGADPRASVVDSFGAHHHVDGLFVADGSLFPTSIGGPPQIPIYTFGRRVARRIARAR